MADMLVKLYKVNPDYALIEELRKQGIKIKKALSPDRQKVIDFAKNAGTEDYSDEVKCAFSNHPVTCYIAVKEKKIIGFACYEATAKNFFGPIVVSNRERMKGIGKSLLLKSLQSMEEMGYAYAIIGWPAKNALQFYKKTVNAVMIEDESHGIYGRLVEIDD